MPGRTGRSGAGSCPDNPRAQSPRPVWVCGAGLFFVPPYKEGEVRNLGHYYCCCCCCCYYYYDYDYYYYYYDDDDYYYYCCYYYYYYGVALKFVS